MAYASVIYTGNGSTTQFAVTFPYIRKEHVKVYVNFVDTAYTYVNNTTVQLAAAPANGARVEVKRITPAANPLVDFTDGSTLVAADLDAGNLQHLYLEQELDDALKQTVSIDPSTGLPSAGGQRITNVANPINAQDVATKAYSDANKVDAQAFANAAAASAALANDWATKTSSAVAGGEFSAKYHAQAAASSASAADGHKTAAQAAQAAAESARDSTLAAYDSFDDRYLGVKTSDPAVDNDGNPLVAGTLYFSSTLNQMRLYTGSTWVAAYVSGTAGSIGFTPAGNIAATNVQAALQELDTEKLALSGGTLSGNVDNTATGYFDLPVGTTAQRPASPSTGYVRFNTDIGQFEGYNGTAWSSIGGGAAGGGADRVFLENDATVTQSYTITAGRNAVSAGPVTIGAGAVVTIPSGSSWVIV